MKARTSLSPQLRALGSLPPDEVAASLAPPARRERRHGPHTWIQASNVVSAVAWVVFALALAYGDSARPHWRGIGLDTWLGVERRSTWDEHIVAIAFTMMLVSFVFGIVALAIRSRYMRRQTDKVPWASVVVTAFSGIALLAYLSILH